MAFPTMPRRQRGDYIDPPTEIKQRSPAAQRGWFAGFPSACPPPAARTTLQIVRPSDQHVFRFVLDDRLSVLFGEFLALAQADERFELRTRMELSDSGRAQGGNGSFACRSIRGDPSQPSNHSSATAIDLWTRSNPLARNRGFISTIHPQVVELAGAALIYWGGWYYDDGTGFIDAMHFEFMGTPDDVPRALKALHEKADELRGQAARRRRARSR